jgi:hypothetical protein
MEFGKLKTGCTYIKSLFNFLKTKELAYQGLSRSSQHCGINCFRDGEGHASCEAALE